MSDEHEPTGPEEGLALCLSGGGYRAMLFHVGVLWRLNDAGMLPELDRISSVSGGSITAGVLGLAWPRLDFDDNQVSKAFEAQVADPIRGLARTNVDVTAVLTGLALPFRSISDQVVKAYRNRLFGKATLQDLPDRPRIVLNATNVGSGALMRFSKAYVADYRVGRIDHPDVPLAQAVGASSAFPPFVSPCVMDLSHEDWVTEEGNDLAEPEFRNDVQLTDGGVYDNLGLETVWKRYRTVLVSDAGGAFAPDDDPPVDWPRHMVRVLKVIDNQVRSLRKRQIIDGFRNGDHEGMYVGIRSDLADYGLADALPADPSIAKSLARIPTRLDVMDESTQERLVNWGYVIADAGLRKHVRPSAAAGRLPYPARALVR
ncbi:MAG TPA: patatin-like phospholipase family protein [Nocardioides sp.]|jgi:NTE family protein